MISNLTTQRRQLNTDENIQSLLQPTGRTASLFLLSTLDKLLLTSSGLISVNSEIKHIIRKVVQVSHRSGSAVSAGEKENPYIRSSSSEKRENNLKVILPLFHFIHSYWQVKYIQQTKENFYRMYKFCL